VGPAIIFLASDYKQQIKKPPETGGFWWFLVRKCNLSLGKLLAATRFS
jgi:hypothetical protein